MFKIKKALYLFSLFLLTHSGYAGESIIISDLEDGETEKPSKALSQTSLPNKTDFESGVAGLKRTLNLNEKSGKIPDNLVELNEAFKDVIERAKSDEKPDNIDIAVLIDTNGKSQTVAAMRFLANIENTLIESANKKNPDMTMKLASVVDAFVAAGSGAIPASIAALGEITQEEALSHVRKMPTKMLFPKSVGGFFSCCGCFGDTVGAIVSAYFSTPVLLDKDSPGWDSLTYDSFNFEKSRGEYLLKLFGSNSIKDLKSSLEVISLSDSDSISGLVFGTIFARDSDARSKVKRLAVAEVLSFAENALTISSTIKQGSAFSKKAASAVEGIGDISLLLKKSAGSEYGPISYLRDSLLKNTDIARDMVILNISADTFLGKILVPSFSYDVKFLRNGKKIININYRFAIPSYLYTPKKSQLESFQSVIDNGVKSVFPNEITGRRSNISIATGMLINFLDECNTRVLQEISRLQ